MSWEFYEKFNGEGLECDSCGNSTDGLWQFQEKETNELSKKVCEPCTKIVLENM